MLRISISRSVRGSSDGLERVESHACFRTRSQGIRCFTRNGEPLYSSTEPQSLPLSKHLRAANYHYSGCASSSDWKETTSMCVPRRGHVHPLLEQWAFPLPTECCPKTQSRWQGAPEWVQTQRMFPPATHNPTTPDAKGPICSNVLFLTVCLELREKRGGQVAGLLNACMVLISRMRSLEKYGRRPIKCTLWEQLNMDTQSWIGTRIPHQRPTTAPKC